MNTGNVYSVASTNLAWIEGVGDIEIALQDELSWNGLEADGLEGVQKPWAGSPGASTIGTDYETSSIGTWSFDANSARGIEIVIELDIDRV